MLSSRSDILRNVTFCGVLVMTSPFVAFGQMNILAPWTASVSVGTGGAHVGVGGDTALKSSAFVLVQANASVRVLPRVFVGADLAVMPYAFAGDCTYLCSQAARFQSLAATASYAFASSATSRIPLLTVGAGASQFPAIRPSPQRQDLGTTVASYILELAFPMSSHNRSGLFFGLRATILPDTPAGALTAWSLHLGYRKSSRSE
jgi:hypothetical protein